ncbi:MAG: cytoplasmic protein [Pseudomonadota bacterium]
MPNHTHCFVEDYDGLVGFGFDRKGNEDTLTYYLQKFSDDENMALMRERMSDEELEEVFNLLSGLLKRHLKEEEYHRVFLKDRQNA